MSSLQISVTNRTRVHLQRARLAEFAVDVERHVVEQLPQHAVAEAVVVQVHLPAQRYQCQWFSCQPFMITKGALQRLLGMLGR